MLLLLLLLPCCCYCYYYGYCYCSCCCLHAYAHVGSPPQLEQVESNPYLKMLTQEKYEDGDSPEKLAAREKELGNIAFRGGPEMYGNALKHYKVAPRCSVWLCAR
jgi:hypothetical protein